VRGMNLQPLRHGSKSARLYNVGMWMALGYNG
jgi:hypothetical protein